MTNDLRKQKADAEARFEEWYVDAVKSGDIPLEFAGAQGKKVLNSAFHCGCGHIVFTMLKLILDKKLGEKT